MPTSIGFCVIYQFRVAADKEAEFREGWTRLTREIRTRRGGLGSRLHRAGEGWWLAYAQWPDRETWERSQPADPIDQEAVELMQQSISERKAPIELTPQIDLLVPASAE